MNGPRTWISPTLLPSHGWSVPASPRTRSSTSGTGTPASDARRKRSSSDASFSSARAYDTVAIGLVSVMPQPWRIWMSYFANARISDSGTAEPPTSDFMPRGSVQRPWLAPPGGSDAIHGGLGRAHVKVDVAQIVVGARIIRPEA